jgi:hypothetical protein
VVYASVIVVQRKDKKMNKEIVIEGFKCVECEDTYYHMPSFGYCDNTLECAISDGDSVKPHSWVANEGDVRYLVRSI